MEVKRCKQWLLVAKVPKVSFGRLPGVWRAAPGLCSRDGGRGFAREAVDVHGPGWGTRQGRSPVPWGALITCSPATVAAALTTAAHDIKALRSLPDQAGQSRKLWSQAPGQKVQAQSLQGLAASAFKERGRSHPPRQLRVRRLCYLNPRRNCRCKHWQFFDTKQQPLHPQNCPEWDTSSKGS